MSISSRVRANILKFTSVAGDLQKVRATVRYVVADRGCKVMSATSVRSAAHSDLHSDFDALRKDWIKIHEDFVNASRCLDKESRLAGNRRSFSMPLSGDPV